MNYLKFKSVEVRRGYKVSGRMVRCTIIYRLQTNSYLLKYSNRMFYTQIYPKGDAEYKAVGESFCYFNDAFDLKKGKEIAYRRAYSKIMAHIKEILKDEKKAVEVRLKAIDNSIDIINEKLNKNHDLLIKQTEGKSKTDRK